MKVWHSYGSEHSSNIVMIGHFKTTEDAKKINNLIEELTNGLQDKVEIGENPDRYNDDVKDLLREKNCYSLSPSELEQFVYDKSIHMEGDKVIIKTEEYDISVFLKLMIGGGAKVEIFSAHDYSDSKYGRGK